MQYRPWQDVRASGSAVSGWVERENADDEASLLVPKAKRADKPVSRKDRSGDPRCACGAYISRYSYDDVCAPCMSRERQARMAVGS